MNGERRRQIKRKIGIVHILEKVRRATRKVNCCDPVVRFYVDRI